jgi:hypothetical protein
MMRHMTVDQLRQALEDHPGDAEVKIGYDTLAVTTLQEIQFPPSGRVILWAYPGSYGYQEPPDYDGPADA